MSDSADRRRRVLAAGLSPAWQQILVFDEFHTGRVNRASEVFWCGSGKVLNVAIALAQLSRDSQITSRALSVSGGVREMIQSELAALDVCCRWVETASDTRICTTIVERATGRVTELVENPSPLTADEVAQFRDAFDEELAAADIVVLTGSLPGGAPTTFYRDVLQQTDAQAVLDARGPELLAALECCPLVVKPNREELARTFDRDFRTDADLHAAMRELNQRGARWAIVTNGADAVWASHNGDFFRFKSPRVERVVNPIGSGDCLAAGIAWATASGLEMLDAIRLGIAAAANNVEQLLPARLDRRRIAASSEQVTWARMKT